MEGENLLEFSRGQVVNDRYTVIDLVGKGGVGCIYKVHDNVLDEDVALKTLLPNYARDKVIVDRFLNEARIARKLTHSNIVRVHDIGSTGTSAYISMEYLQGETLRHLLDRMKPGEHIPLMQVLRITDELCRALEYAHQFTVHRDIKPDNVMLEKSGRVKLMDFGISKLMDNVQLTGAAMIMGTPYYMSPEQLRDSHDVDARADIFSVGVVLYEMLTGNRPTGIPKPASEMHKEVPPVLDEIVGKCVEADREKRYQSIRELRNALRPVAQALMEGRDLRNTAPVTPLNENQNIFWGGNVPGGVATREEPPAPAAQPSKQQQDSPARPASNPVATPAPTPSAPVSLVFDPAALKLDDIDTPSVRKHAAPSVPGGWFPEIGRKMFIAGAVLAALVLLFVGTGFARAWIKDMRGRDAVQQARTPNRALEMLGGGTPLVEVFDEALNALSRNNNSGEDVEIAEKVRLQFLEDVAARINSFPYSLANMNSASADIARAAQRDGDARVQKMRERINREISYHNFILKTVDQAKGTATFMLNNPMVREKEETVSEGELLQGRFLVKKIGSNFVRLEDPEVRSQAGTPRTLMARLMDRVSGS